MISRLKESFYLAMIILGLLALSFHLANAQTITPAPDNDNQKIIYMRDDTVFQIGSDGVEVPLLPPQAYQRHIDSLEAALFLYKPKPGRVFIELDTVDNRMVYREKIGRVKVSNLYDDSLWVTDEIFVTVHRFVAPLKSWNAFYSGSYESQVGSLRFADWLKYQNEKALSGLTFRLEKRPPEIGEMAFLIYKPYTFFEKAALVWRTSQNFVQTYHGVMSFIDDDTYYTMVVVEAEKEVNWESDEPVR